MFNVFPWTRAIPATPEEPAAAFVIVLRGECCLRPLGRGSTSSMHHGATCGFTFVTAHVLALPGLRRGPRGSLCAAGELHASMTFHMANALPFAGTTLLFTAHPQLQTQEDPK